MSAAKYQRALAGYGRLLIRIRNKDIAHRRREGHLDANEAAQLRADVAAHGAVLTSADIEAMRLRFTCDARAAIAAGAHDAPEAFDE